MVLQRGCSGGNAVNPVGLVLLKNTVAELQPDKVRLRRIVLNDENADGRFCC